MQPLSIGRMILSKLSLTFLQSTGWYKVDMERAEKLDWGRGAGCNFLNSECISTNFSEFCENQGQNMCSKDRMSKSRCFSTGFSDSCKLNLPLSNYSCSDRNNFNNTAPKENQSNSARCFDTSFLGSNSSACYERKCTLENEIIIVYDGSEYKCSYERQSIYLGQLIIFFPFFDEICEKSHCKNNCN